MAEKYCDNCVSATYPFRAKKHPKQRWCSKTSQFVLLDGLCRLWTERTLTKKIEQKQQPQQLELNFRKEVIKVAEKVALLRSNPPPRISADVI